MSLFSTPVTYTITPLEKRSMWLDLELNKPYETTMSPSHRKLIHWLERPYVIYKENPEDCFFWWLVNSGWEAPVEAQVCKEGRLWGRKQREGRLHFHHQDNTCCRIYLAVFMGQGTSSPLTCWMGLANFDPDPLFWFSVSLITTSFSGCHISFSYASPAATEILFLLDNLFFKKYDVFVSQSP